MGIPAEVLGSIAGALTGAIAPRLIELMKVGLEVPRKLRAAEEKRFSQTIENANLDELRAFLRDDLGSFTIEEYARDSVVRKRVDRLLQTAEALAAPVTVSNSPPSRSIKFPPPPPEFDKISGYLDAGRIVEAMALMRLVIEKELRKFLGTEALTGTPIGMLLKLAEQRDEFQEGDEAQRHLRFAIGVANKAIHGEEITQSEAEQAFESGSYAAGFLVGVRSFGEQT